MDQITNPGKKTTLRVICPPGTEHKEIYDFENINSLKDYVSHDDGETFDPKFVYPKSMDSKRLQIRYSEDGGELKDGVVEIRRGVDDLSLGESHYAQVRILVDGSHYIKGMAVYSDDFGKNFAQYSNYMKNVDANIVTATTNAATSIVELQKSLPKEGGWFSDDMTLSSFGSDMASFGSYFGNYYNSISGIDTTLLSSVITQTNRLVSMANGMVGLDTSGMTSFSSALTTLGENGVTGFINAFNNAESRVATAASSMLASFINGANAKKSELTTTFITLVQAVLTAINGKQGEFQTSGSTLMIKFIAGVRSKDGELRTAFTTTLSGAITSIKDYYGEFKSAGSYLVDGFCNGISENTWKAEAKARAMAAAAAEAAEDELDEHSPSKRFYGIGNFAGVGFINALIDNVSKAGKAGREIAKSSIDGLNDVISRIADYVDADMDVQPTIRPVLDLSAVEAGTGRLNTLFSRNQALSVSTGIRNI